MVIVSRCCTLLLFRKLQCSCQIGRWCCACMYDGSYRSEEVVAHSTFCPTLSKPQGFWLKNANRWHTLMLIFSSTGLVKLLPRQKQEQKATTTTTEFVAVRWEVVAGTTPLKMLIWYVWTLSWCLFGSATLLWLPRTPSIWPDIIMNSPVMFMLFCRAGSTSPKRLDASTFSWCWFTRYRSGDTDFVLLHCEGFPRDLAW